MQRTKMKSKEELIDFITENDLVGCVEVINRNVLKVPVGNLEKQVVEILDCYIDSNMITEMEYDMLKRYYKNYKLKEV